MRYSDGLFLKTAEQESHEFPDIEWQEIQIDHLTSRLAKEPGEFDVLLLPNLYGDIISDLCAGLVGGLGLIPGANIGWEYAVFEPVHGSAPDIAGQGKANPIAMILSGAMMLRHIGELAAAENWSGRSTRCSSAERCERPISADPRRRCRSPRKSRPRSRHGSTARADPGPPGRSVFVRVVMFPVGAPTEVPVIQASTAGLAVVPAAAPVHEALRAVAERQPDLLGEPVVGVAPVGEERARRVSAAAHGTSTCVRWYPLGPWRRLLGTDAHGMPRCADERARRRAPGPPTPTARSMRLAGFGLTALGGLLIGVGALMPWIRSSLAGLPDALSPTYYGIDLPDGLIVLAAAASCSAASRSRGCVVAPGAARRRRCDPRGVVPRHHGRRHRRPDRGR